MPRGRRSPLFIMLLGLIGTMPGTLAQADSPLPDRTGEERAVARTPSTTPPPIGANASFDGAAAYMPDRVLVRLKPASATRTRLRSGTTKSSARLGIPSLDAIGAKVGAVSAEPAIATPQNSSVASDLGLEDWVLIELAPGSDVQAAIAAYRADPSVEVAEPDYIFQPLVKPTDPLYVQHWGHNNTGQFKSATSTGVHNGPFVGTVGFDANAELGWTGPNGFGLASVKIAILDTGVDLTHPDLTVVAGYDTGDNDSNPQDDSATPGHGTACAGVAAAKANNGRGACGSAPGCSIMPMKVANSFGAFAFVFIANAIVWAADHDADVISMSFGFYPPPPQEGSALIDAAIEYASAAGVVMFSGTGNANNSLMLYPASHPKVISVGAASMCGDRKRSSFSPVYLAPGVSPDPNNVTCDGVRWWGSSWGSATQDAPDAVDILAPTLLPLTDIQGAGGYVPGDYALNFNGVSCSVPYVAGVAALIKSKHPDWTPAQIRQQLMSTAQDVVNVESGAGWDRYSGYGMVDLNAAAGCGTTPPSITVVMDRDALWPPDHRMVPCRATVITTDDCDAAPDVALVSVVSDEPDDPRGGGNTVSDIGGADFGTDDRCFDLRSERTNEASGRCYTIVYSATDASGNVAYDTVEVRVPHDQSAVAIGSRGFTADGSGLDAGAATFALFVTGSATLEPQTTVHFSLPNSERVRISIYDVTGALVRQLVDETKPAGQHRVRWDGNSNRGTGVTSGVYFVRIMAGSYSAVRRVVLLE